MEKNSRILVTGATGELGNALVSRLKKEGFRNLLMPNSKDLNLRKKKQVETFFFREKPEFVFHLASRVGSIGEIQKNSSEFLEENIMITLNVIEAAKKGNVNKLINVSSACIYPRIESREIFEDDLLSAKLEIENESYALAKIVGVKEAQYCKQQYKKRFISVVPTNFYGSKKDKHVVRSLIYRVMKAKKEGEEEVTVWGSGKAKRDFIHINDLAEILVKVMELDIEDDFLNIPGKNEVSIEKLSRMITNVIGFKGKITFDTTKPEGTKRRCLSSEVFDKYFKNFKFKNLEEGIREEILIIESGINI